MRTTRWMLAAAWSGVLAIGCSGGGGASAKAPAAPSNLAGMPMDAGSHLTWTDNSGNEDGFVVQRKDPGAADFSSIATTTFDVTLYHDAFVTTGMTYSYRVYATNGAGASAPSNTVDVTP